MRAEAFNGCFSANVLWTEEDRLATPVAPKKCKKDAQSLKNTGISYGRIQSKGRGAWAAALLRALSRMRVRRVWSKWAVPVGPAGRGKRRGSVSPD